MRPIPHCQRCGYANAPSWARCCCCGRRLGDHDLPPHTTIVRAGAAHRVRRPRRLPNADAFVVPVTAAGATAASWLAHVTADERAYLLTVVAAATTVATF